MLCRWVVFIVKYWNIQITENCISWALLEKILLLFCALKRNWQFLHQLATILGPVTYSGVCRRDASVAVQPTKKSAFVTIQTGLSKTPNTLKMKCDYSAHAGAAGVLITTIWCRRVTQQTGGAHRQTAFSTVLRTVQYSLSSFPYQNFVP